MSLICHNKQALWRYSGRWMPDEAAYARGTAGPRGGVTMETKRGQVELFNEDIDNTSKVILSDPVIQTLGEKCGLVPADTFDETRHVKPPNPTKA